jgi:hypothetical protein
MKKLRDLDFRLDIPGHRGVRVFEKTLPKVRLIVELWQDGDTRIGHSHVTHFHHGITPYGVMDSVPSYFSSVDGMVKAIEFETTRTELGVDKNLQKFFN